MLSSVATSTETMEPAGHGLKTPKLGAKYVLSGLCPRDEKLVKIMSLVLDGQTSPGLAVHCRQALFTHGLFSSR